MLSKEIIFLGNKVVIACDEKCDKAWGLNCRPKVQLDPNDEDDFAFLADEELGIAPENPGTYEGSSSKPVDDSEKLNKWCCRECERCVMSNFAEDIKLRDFSKRLYNKKQCGEKSLI